MAKRKKISEKQRVEALTGTGTRREIAKRAGVSQRSVTRIKAPIRQAKRGY